MLVVVVVIVLVVVVVGSADTAVRVCIMMSNAMSTPEIEAENTMNRRQVIGVALKYSVGCSLEDVFNSTYTVED